MAIDKAKVIYDSIENLVHYDDEFPYSKEEAEEILVLAKELLSIIKTQQKELNEMGNELQLIDDMIMKDGKPRKAYSIPAGDPMFDEIISLLGKK